MAAQLLFHQRIDYDDGGIVEMVIWRVPAPVSPSVHDLKYSLFFAHLDVERCVTTTNEEKAITGISGEPKRITRSRASRS
jgi:hypothetical protein